MSGGGRMERAGEEVQVGEEAPDCFRDTKTHTSIRENDSVFSLPLSLHVSSRGAAWPRSPWWRRPGWSRASSCCSPSSACSSSWWRWQCPLLSSACASAPTSAWRRSWPAWELTPVLMPLQPIRLDQPLQYEPITGRNTWPELCYWKNSRSARMWSIFWLVCESAFADLCIYLWVSPFTCSYCVFDVFSNSNLLFFFKY